MLPHDFHRPHSSIDFRMATPRPQKRGLLAMLYDAWSWFAHVGIVLLIIFCALVVCYAIAPPEGM